MFDGGCRGAGRRARAVWFGRREKMMRARQAIRNIILLLPLLLLLAGQNADAAELTVNTTQGRGEALAFDPVRHSESFSAVLYNNTNGLPTSEANAIAETSEGFLWIGGYSGLIRYDGHTFERISPSTGVTSVRALYVDHRDRLWIGTNDNGFAVMERGEVRRWDKTDGVGSDSIRAIAEDENGAVYIATTGGVVMVDPEGTLHLFDDPLLSESNMYDLRRGPDGLLYGLTNAGELFTIRNGAVVSDAICSDYGMSSIGGMLPDPANPGCVFLEAEGHKIYYGRLEEGFSEIADISPLSSVSAFEYVEDRLWICARNGVGVLDGSGVRVIDNLPMTNSVNSMLLDYEGNLWFTSSRQGVMKLVSNQFADLYQHYDLPRDVVNSTCMYHGQLFVGTDTGLTVLDEGGVVRSVPLNRAETASGVPIDAEDLIELLRGCRIRSIIRDSKNRLWISAWEKIGLLCYDAGELVTFGVEDGMPSNRVRTVCERRDGSIAVALVGGAVVIEDGRITGSYGAESGIENYNSLTIEGAPNGDILLGTDGSGIYVIGREGVRHFGKEDGLRSEIIMRIKYDPQLGLYWLVTGNSIAYMTEEYRITTIESFPYSNNYDLFRNSKGEVWVLSSNGIYVLPAEELLADRQINPIHYGIANGLPCVATGNSYSELTGDGDLYISGNQGVVKLNIEEPFENVGKLKAAVPFLDADGVRVYPDETNSFSIGPRVQKLTVYAYVFNYSLTDPLVTYQLEGFDHDSVTVRRSELVPISYTNLRGGTYHFTLQLSGLLGGEGGRVSVQIVKQRAFYEEIWFFVLAGVCTAGLAVTLVWQYVRRKIRLLQKKHREQAERERIDAELEMAKRIQGGMLPNVFPAFPDRPEFDIYATMAPAKEVGGDFYDFFLVDEDHLALVVADVSGKGVPAALFSMIAKTIIKTHTQAKLSPEEVFSVANASLCENNEEEMFVTAWLGVLEISTGELTYADAGHERLLLYQNGAWRVLPKAGGIALAALSPEDLELVEDAVKSHNQTIRLNPGDAIFQYSDGVTEAATADRSFFGEAGLLAALNSAPSAKPEELLPHVRAAIDAFVQGAPQNDDVTMLELRYNGQI